MIAAERQPLPVVLVGLGEIVGRTMEEAGHAGKDDLTHVGSLCLLRRVGQVAVDGVAHLGVYWAAVLFPSAGPDVRLGECRHGRHPPVPCFGLAAMTSLAADPI